MIHNSQFSTLIELLRWRAAHQSEQVGYTCLFADMPAGNTITYNQLDRQARNIAAHLAALGTTGERALLLYPPGLAYIAAFFGCLYAGIVAVPTYPPDPLRLKQTLPRFQAIVQDARPAVVLTTESILAMARGLFATYPGLGALHWMATDALADDWADQWRPPQVDGEVLAFLQYTSGSTAAPKGVMVSHANLLHNLSYIQQAFQLSSDSVSLTWLPHIHDMGLIDGILQPLYSGCSAYLMSPLMFVQRPFRWLKAITDYRVTHSGGPNFAYELCLRKVQPEQSAELELSCWLSAYNGAEPVRASTLQAFSQIFAEAGFRPHYFYPCYGLAEATLMVSGVQLGEMPCYRSFDSVALGQGQVVPVESEQPAAQTLVGCGANIFADTQIVIADPVSGHRCPPGQVGEIWVSGPGIAQGYWQRTKETEETFQAYLADTGQGPFMRTGDLGFLDHKHLFVAGRIKDLIILNGRNYYPQDIEQSVEACHPALRPGCSAAFSVDQDNVERLVIVAEVRSGRETGVVPEAERLVLANHIKRAVGEHHEVIPDDVVLLAAGTIPKTSSGKIQRHACRTGYLTGELLPFAAG
ncbi:MAG: fatty acyl-AMP ligase [Chloroflexi bacterium]|nr:fatty acyl-AMP ligase [Chloroflexota bacterium]MCI0578239.1 fatty acyl-AMP ligase [Chloroflexota bacterium]MCI0649677.1 fatty acyl-AMP ligase [Chloroflexota bacterium]MCI0728837.1 fatty acyl-AMP ligase [Chloroflexota bacterium]